MTSPNIFNFYKGVYNIQSPTGFFGCQNCSLLLIQNQWGYSSNFIDKNRKYKWSITITITTICRLDISSKDKSSYLPLCPHRFWWTELQLHKVCRESWGSAVRQIKQTTWKYWYYMVFTHLRGWILCMKTVKTGLHNIQRVCLRATQSKKSKSIWPGLTSYYLSQLYEGRGAKQNNMLLKCCVLTHGDTHLNCSFELFEVNETRFIPVSLHLTLFTLLCCYII